MKLLKNVTLCFVIPFVLATAAQGADGFTPTGNLGTSRSGHTATLLPNGKVLVAGGNAGVVSDPEAGPLSSPYVLASAELYDPATGTWSPIGSLAKARQYQTATLLPNGKVLVPGGYNPSAGFASDSAELTWASAELYDPGIDAWSFTGSLVTGRLFHTATLLPNGLVLVGTGHYDYFVTHGSLNSAELYETAPPFLNPITRPMRLGDGSFQFGFGNPSGTSYHILAIPISPRPSTPGRTSAPPPKRRPAPASSSSPTIRRRTIRNASTA